MSLLARLVFTAFVGYLAGLNVERSGRASLFAVRKLLASKIDIIFGVGDCVGSRVMDKRSR